MLKFAIVCPVTLISLVGCLVLVQRATAQQASKKAARESSEAERKARILASDRWRQVEREFSEWLSVQVVYTPEQAGQLKAKLAAQTQSMSADELQAFLDEWDAKLKILLGKDAMEAREWLGQNLAVMAAGYRQEFMRKLGLSDTSKMTAAQIEEAIIRVRAERLSRQQQSAAFEQSRQAMVKAVEKANASEQTALDRAASQPAAQYSGYQSPYSPRRYDYVRPPGVWGLGYWW
jgi:hypothetical protein